MTIRIAYETLRKFEESVAADQGSSFRGWLGKVISHIGDAYRTGEDGHRTHMGASLIGGECPRAIWYNFRWVTKPKFSGRIIRLFNRGHLEEARFIALLLSIGCQVYQQDENGNQFRVSHVGGHFGGSGDGIVVNCPDVPTGASCLTEFKTHGEKSFVELAGKLDEWRKHVERPKMYPFTGKGVRNAKFEHYVQMNIYMRKMGIPIALYVAVNKNTDDIYAEVILLDTEIADQFLERGEKLVWAEKPPAKINQSAGFYKCRFCDHRPVCHMGAAPDRNCRTCIFSKPVADGKWACTQPDVATDDIPKAIQLTGCDHYVARKDM